MSNRRPALILIRHGQTDWNIARRYQGQTETELNQTGRVQMAATAQALAEQTIDRVIASPLRRAVSSAEIVARPHRLAVETDPRLIELHLGRWQGQSYRLRESDPDWFEKAPHGGETGQAFCARISDWLAEVKINETTVLVSHGLVIQVILMLISEHDFDYWHDRPIKNGGFTRLIWNSREWELDLFNDDRHLVNYEL